MLLHHELSKLGGSPSSVFPVCGFRRTRGRLDGRIEDGAGRAHGHLRQCNRLAGRRAAVRLAAEAELRKRKIVTMRPEAHPQTVGEEMRQLVAGDEMRQPKDIDPREITATATVLPPPVWGKKCVTATMLAPHGRRDRKSTRLNSSHVSESRLP